MRSRTCCGNTMLDGRPMLGCKTSRSGCRKGSAADHSRPCGDIAAVLWGGETSRRADRARAGTQGETNDEAYVMVPPGKRSPDCWMPTIKSATSLTTWRMWTDRHSHRSGSRAYPSLTRQPCRSWTVHLVLDVRSGASASSLPWGSTTRIMPPSRTWRSQASRSSSPRRSAASLARMTTWSCHLAQPRATGRLNSASSWAGRPGT